MYTLSEAGFFIEASLPLRHLWYGLSAWRFRRTQCLVLSGQLESGWLLLSLQVEELIYGLGGNSVRRYKAKLSKYHSLISDERQI